MALKLGDLGLVLEETCEARARWYDLGLALRVSVPTLESIKAEYSDPKDRHREMLAAWLKHAEPQPTWEAMIKALASKVVEEGPLAKRLEDEYCQGDV